MCFQAILQNSIRVLFFIFSFFFVSNTVFAQAKKYTINGIIKDSSSGEKISINQLWNRRHTTKFNGVSYPIQKAAAACYSDSGKKEVKDNINKLK